MDYSVIEHHIDIFRNALVKYNVFSDVPICWTDHFVYPPVSDINLSKLRKTYNLDKFATHTDIETIKNILRWVNEIMLFKDVGSYDGSYTSVDILDYSRRHRKVLNCAMHSIVLTEALSSLGFKCRSIQCLPFDPLDDDSHFINIVYVGSLQKWIAVDPSFSVYFLGKDGDYLNLRDLRNKYVENGEINIVRHTRFPESRGFNMHWYRAYLAKNLFRFSCAQESVFTKTKNTIYFLEPEGYRRSNTEEHVNNNIHRYIGDTHFFWED